MFGLEREWSVPRPQNTWTNPVSRSRPQVRMTSTLHEERDGRTGDDARNSEDLPATDRVEVPGELRDVETQLCLNLVEYRACISDRLRMSRCVRVSLREPRVPTVERLAGYERSGTRGPKCDRPAVRTPGRHGAHGDGTLQNDIQPHDSQPRKLDGHIELCAVWHKSADADVFAERGQTERYDVGLG